MITIEDNDLPITVAQKIICGTKPSKQTPLMKAMCVAVTGESNAGDTMDMFSDEEIEEIVSYLKAYLDARTRLQFTDEVKVQ